MNFAFKEISYTNGLNGEIVSTHKPTRYVKLRNDLKDEDIIKAYHDAVIKEEKQFEKDCEITEYYFIIKEDLMKILNIDKDDFVADTMLDIKLGHYGGSLFIEEMAEKWYAEGNKPSLWKEVYGIEAE